MAESRQNNIQQNIIHVLWGILYIDKLFADIAVYDMRCVLATTIELIGYSPCSPTIVASVYNSQCRCLALLLHMQHTNELYKSAVSEQLDLHIYIFI